MLVDPAFPTVSGFFIHVYNVIRNTVTIITIPITDAAVYGYMGSGKKFDARIAMSAAMDITGITRYPRSAPTFILPSRNVDVIRLPEDIDLIRNEKNASAKRST